MSNTILIKHTESTNPPTTDVLQPYELGYVKNGALYINDGGTIRAIGGSKIEGGSNGIVNAPTLVCDMLAITDPWHDDTPTMIATLTYNSALGSNYLLYRTPTEIRGDIGALSTSGGTVSGALTVAGKLTANGTIVVDSDSYGKSVPTAAGTTGQLYFVLTE